MQDSSSPIEHQSSQPDVTGVESGNTSMPDKDGNCGILYLKKGEAKEGVRRKQGDETRKSKGQR